MAIHTLNPNFDVTDPYDRAPGKNGSSGANYAILSDATVATWLSYTYDSSGSPCGVIVGLQDLTLSTGEYITAARINISFKAISVGNPDFHLFFFDGASGERASAEEHYTTNNVDFNLYTGSWQSVGPGDVDWTLDMVQRLCVRATDTAFGTAVPGLAELSVDIQTRFAPVVTPQVSAVVGTTKPTWNWSYASKNGTTQQTFHIKVFSKTQSAAPGFDPETAKPLVDTDVVNSSASSWTIKNSLTNGQVYTFAIKVSDGFADSAWTSSDVTISVEIPATPVLTVTTDNDPPVAHLSVVSYDNLLTYGASSAEDPSYTNYSVRNGSPTRSSVGTPLEGTYVYNITTGPAAADTHIDFDKGSIPVKEGVVYSAAANVRPGASFANRYCSVELTFYDVYGVLISSIEGPDVKQIADNAQWTQVVLPVAPAPLGAVGATLTVNIKGTPIGDVHDLDCMIVSAGPFNLVRNWTGENDANSDGLGDHWSQLILGGGSVANFYEPGLTPMYGTAWSGFQVSGNSNIAGIQQILSLPGSASGYYAYFSVLVFSPNDCYVFVNVDQLGYKEVFVPANVFTPITMSGPLADQPTSGMAPVQIGLLLSVGTLYWTGVQVGLSPTALPTFDPALDVWPNNWTRGGLSGTSTHEIERSDDNEVTWVNVRRLSDSSTLYGGMQTYNVDDAEVPTQNPNIRYRVRKHYVSSTGAIAVSSWSNYAAVPAPIAPSSYWLVSTSQAGIAAACNVEQGGFTEDREEPQGLFRLLGRTNPITIRGVLAGRSGKLKIDFISQAEFDAFEEMRELQETLWLASPIPEDSIYVDLGPSAEATVTSAVGGSVFRSLDATYSEVDRPGVVALESAPVSSAPAAPDPVTPPSSPVYTGLFDDPTLPTPYACWSVDALSEAAFTTNKCVTVTRTDTHASADFGFDSSGHLDTAAILTFCGSATGIVTKFWDQSGNGFHFVFTETTGWTICASGSITLPPTGTSKPTLKAADAARGAVVSGSSFTGSKVTSFVVGSVPNTATTLSPRFLSLANASLADNDTGHSGTELPARNGQASGSTGYRVDRGSGPQATAPGTANTLQQITTTVYDGVTGGYDITVDGTAGTAATVSLGAFNTTRLGMGHTGLTPQSVAGQCISEMILFTTDLTTSQRSTIALSQQTRFGTASQTAPTPTTGATLVAQDSLSSQSLPLPSGEWLVYDNGHSTQNAAAWMARDVLKSGDTLILQGKKNSSPITVNGQQYLRECGAVYWLGSSHLAELDQGIWEVDMMMDGNSLGWGNVLMCWTTSDSVYPWPTGREYDIIEIFSGNASKQGGESFMHYDTTVNSSRQLHAPGSTTNSSSADVSAGNYRIDWTTWHTVTFKWIRGSLLQVFIDGVSKAQITGSSYNPANPDNTLRFGCQQEGYGTSDSASSSLFRTFLKNFKAYTS